MSKYVTVKMYYQKWERFNGDGYCPSTEDEEGNDGSNYETFHLNNDGEWTQEYIYDEPENLKELQDILGQNYISREVQMKRASIYSLDGDSGVKLLKILNAETRQQQLDNGVEEKDIQTGFAISNIMGACIYKHRSSDVPH
jgi:hypothetical protein